MLQWNYNNVGSTSKWVRFNLRETLEVYNAYFFYIFAICLSLFIMM